MAKRQTLLVFSISTVRARFFCAMCVVQLCIEPTSYLFLPSPHVGGEVQTPPAEDPRSPPRPRKIVQSPFNKKIFAKISKCARRKKAQIFLAKRRSLAHRSRFVRADRARRKQAATIVGHTHDCAASSHGHASSC